MSGSFEMLELVRCLQCPGHWLAGLEWLLVGKPGVCGDALLFLLAPCVQRQKAPGSAAGNSLQPSCRQGKAPEWSSQTLSMEVEGNVNKGIQQLLPPREFCSTPRAPSASRPSLPISFSCLLFRSCSFRSQLSHKCNCFLYTCILKFAHEKG